MGKAQDNSIHFYKIIFRVFKNFKNIKFFVFLKNHKFFKWNATNLVL